MKPVLVFMVSSSSSNFDLLWYSESYSIPSILREKVLGIEPNQIFLVSPITTTEHAHKHAGYE